MWHCAMACTSCHNGVVGLTQSPSMLLVDRLLCHITYITEHMAEHNGMASRSQSIHGFYVMPRHCALPCAL
jgi:hypothetical protein